jgi:hypothetical protein
MQLQKFRERGFFERSRDQVTLDQVAAVIEKRKDLVLSLHALGDYFEIEFVRHGNGRSDDGHRTTSDERALTLLFAELEGAAEEQEEALTAAPRSASKHIARAVKALQRHLPAAAENAFEETTSLTARPRELIGYLREGSTQFQTDSL